MSTVPHPDQPGPRPQGQVEPEGAECTCTPLPHGSGPEADCDVHGQPSVAYQQGYSDGSRHWQQIGNLDLVELRADRDRLSAALRAMARKVGHERRYRIAAARGLHQALADRDRWKELAEGWYREHNAALDARDAARLQAERTVAPPAGGGACRG